MDLLVMLTVASVVGIIVGAGVTLGLVRNGDVEKAAVATEADDLKGKLADTKLLNYGLRARLDARDAEDAQNEAPSVAPETPARTLTLGSSHFIEHQPHELQPWSVYAYRHVLVPGVDSGRFCLSTEADAVALMMALDAVAGCRPVVTSVVVSGMSPEELSPVHASNHYTAP